MFSFKCHNTWPENANGDIQIYGIPSVIEPGARYEVDVVVSNQYNNGSWGFQIASVIGQYGVPQGGYTCSSRHMGAPSS